MPAKIFPSCCEPASYCPFFRGCDSRFGWSGERLLFGGDCGCGIVRTGCLHLPAWGSRSKSRDGGKRFRMVRKRFSGRHFRRFRCLALRSALWFRGGRGDMRRSRLTGLFRRADCRSCRGLHACGACFRCADGIGACSVGRGDDSCGSDCGSPYGVSGRTDRSGLSDS